MIKWDGHTHTKFCRHGNPDELERYLDRALELGFARYTVSEHSPLPEGWVQDPQLMKELAMDLDELPEYMAYARECKQRMEGRIELAVGLELDYLAGQERFSEAVVDMAGADLEEVIVSVHFLPGVGGMRCVDFTADDFRAGLLGYYGTMERVVNEYFDHVEQAVEWAGTLPGRLRKRIGHLNLIRKFQQALPPIPSGLVEERLRRLLPKLAANGLGVDVNTAGMRVATCGEPYVPEWFIRECRVRGIACVYGSDAHKPEQLGTGWDWFEKQMNMAPG